MNGIYLYFVNIVLDGHYWDFNVTHLKFVFERVKKCLKMVAYSQQEGHDGPESLTWVIFPTNEFYIFVPLVPTCDPRVGQFLIPRGIIWIKLTTVYKEMLHAKLYPFQFQRRRILKLVLCSYVPTCDPWGGVSFDPKGIIWNKRAKMAWMAHLIFWDCSSQFFFVAFREEFTRISLCLYSARSLHSLIPCLLTDQNFKNNSEKGHSRNISMRLFQNLTNSFREDFLWFCLCAYSQVAPFTRALFMDRS